MKEQQTQINGNDYTTTLFPARQAIGLTSRLSAVMKDGVSDLMKPDDLTSGSTEFLSAIMGVLGSDKAPQLIEDLLKRTWVIGDVDGSR